MTEAGTAAILVVDDDPFNRDVLQQELDLLGHRAEMAAGGREALAALERDSFDAILLDVMMPGLDGFQVLQALRADRRHRDIPVIMISARDDQDSVIRCIELGAEDYLPKPFDPVLLKARLGACLEKKRWRDQEAAYRRTIEEERQRADALLHIILPAPAVQELKATDRVTPRRYPFVAVMFADIVGFTRHCELRPPEDVVADLHAFAEAGEHLVAAHGLEKIKMVGDALLTTGNLLHANADPVMASLRCAFALQEAALATPARWELRTGIHLGPVVAGVVGRRKLGFDVWGDTVNVAARLAELGSPGTISLSADAWAHVAERARARALGPVDLKGKGKLEVHSCLGLGASA